MSEFSGKHVFVAGGTSGINLGIAECFAELGARVAVLSRSEDKVNQAVAQLKDAGALEAQGYIADVRDYDAVAEALSQARAAWGTIDVLVSGAAGNFPVLAKDMSANAFRAVVEIDLLGTFHVCRAAYEHLNRPASIVNISAPQAFFPMALQSHVCAAKAGVDMLTKTLAMEWGHEQIRVNAICPGPIEGTEGMRRLAPGPEMISRMTSTVPTARLGNPEDIGKAVVWLSSESADYVNGVILPVDGGWSLSGVGTAMSAAVGIGD